MPSEMEMQRALEERMRQLLAHASQAKVAEALGVTRTTVHRWAHGVAVTPGAVTRVQALLRPDLPDTLMFLETTEEAAPSLLTRRLLAGVIALENESGITPEALAAAQDEATKFEQLALETDRRLAAELEASQRKSSESATGRAGGQSDVSLGSKRQKR